MGRNEPEWGGSELTLLGSGGGSELTLLDRSQAGICGREPRRPNLGLSQRTLVIAKMS